MENKFTFKIIDIQPYISKENKKYYKVICYCNFDFNVKFYLSEDKMLKLNELMKKDNFDINNYISVFYDNKKQSFAYIIKLK